MGFNSGFKGLSVNKYCHTVRVEPGRASEIHTVLSAFSAGFHNFTFFFSFAKQNVTTRGPFVLVNLTGFFFFYKEAHSSNITFRKDMSYSLRRLITENKIYNKLILRIKYIIN